MSRRRGCSNDFDGTENILIEVKTPGARVDPAKYQRIDQEIARHPGWRFLLVTVPVDAMGAEPSNAPVVSTVDEIRTRMRELDRLAEADVAPASDANLKKFPDKMSDQQP